MCVCLDVVAIEMLIVLKRFLLQFYLDVLHTHAKYVIVASESEWCVSDANVKNEFTTASQ